MRNYVYITDTAGVAKILPELMARKIWGVDTETTGLDCLVDKVILAQFGYRDKQFLVDTRTASLEPLRPFFDSAEHMKILHYAKFDYKMFKGSCGLELEGIRCTFNTEKVIQAGRMRRGFGLADVLQRRLGIEMDKELQKSFINHKGPFSTAQLEYAADDVINLEDLFRHQCTEAHKDGVGRTVALESDVVAAFGDMEYDGMILDVPGWRKILDDNIIAQAQAKNELDQNSLQYVDLDLFGEVAINYASSDQVKDLLNMMGIKVPVRDSRSGKEVMQKITHTDAKSLKRVSHLPVVKLLGKWRSYNVLINTFGEPYIKALHPVTGRLHPDFDQLGTETGRPSAGDSDVNPLNIPRDNRYRHCFTGDPDEVVESDDYSGCESRILAEISGDPRLIEIFRLGLDIHCSVASDLYGFEVLKSGPTSKYRTPAKSLNFGMAYGLGIGKLHEELNGSGFPSTFDESRALYNKYCTKFATAVDFLRAKGREGREQGYLTNLDGRRRYWNKPNPDEIDKQTGKPRFPAGIRDPFYQGILAKIEREGGNFVIQSVNVDITKTAQVGIRNFRKKNNVKTHFVNAIYDEIVTRTKKEQSEEFHAHKLRIMREAAEIWLKKVPMVVDGAVHTYWTK